MGFVHHSIYALYFEEARTECLRSMGLSYLELEDSGIIMPVRSMAFQFLKAAHYDDMLEITVMFDQPVGIRFPFEYETRNQNDQLINTASTELFFARKSDLRPVRLPQHLLDYFKQS